VAGVLEQPVRDDRIGLLNGLGRLIQHQLSNLLQIIDLEAAGVPVAPRAFRLAGAGCRPSGQSESREAGPPPPSRVCYESLAAYRSREPRLSMIGSFLSCLSKCGHFEAVGRRVDFDGFRLKNLAYWAKYPCPYLLDNFGELSSWCSCDCEFCFLKGSRSENVKRSMVSLAEARTRAKYFSPEKRAGLPTPLSVPGEPLANPHAIELLRIARESHPDHVLDITTNGDFLTEAMLDELARLKPLLVMVSLNAHDVEVRRQIMRSRRPEMGVRAIPMLRDRGIQFTGSVVPPATVPLEEIAESMRYLDRYTPIQIRLLLPGYTKYASAVPPFDTRAHWDALVGLAERMRPELRSPLLIQPSFYWNQDIAAFIDGVNPNSPAERAGLKFGDRIVEVGGQPVVTKAEAGYLLGLPPEPGKSWKTVVTVERGKSRFVAQLSNEFSAQDDYYPYKPLGYPAAHDVLGRWSFRIQLIDGFQLEPLQALKEIVESRPEAERVLVFTTPLVQNLFAQARQVVGELPEYRIERAEVRVTMARHNFWGGNIMIGDLHVVQDYIDHLNLLKGLGYCPDLAIIPSSFACEWGFDLLGRSYTEIERRTGIPVELLEVRRIMV